MAHSKREIIIFLCTKAKSRSSMLTSILTQRSNESPLYPAIGWIIPVAPIIQRVLKIFDHTIPPIARSVFFFIAAIILVASSGSDVPIAIIVTPINDFGTQKVSAIETALSTIKFPPYISAVSHPTI